jgi:hypothetical protein
MRVGMRLGREDVDRIVGKMTAFKVIIINGVVNIIQLCMLFLRRYVIEQRLTWNWAYSILLEPYSSRNCLC